MGDSDVFQTFDGSLSLNSHIDEEYQSIYDCFVLDPSNQLMSPTEPTSATECGLPAEPSPWGDPINEDLSIWSNQIDDCQSFNPFSTSVVPQDDEVQNLGNDLLLDDSMLDFTRQYENLEIAVADNYDEVSLQDCETPLHDLGNSAHPAEVASEPQLLDSRRCKRRKKMSNDARQPKKTKLDTTLSDYCHVLDLGLRESSRARTPLMKENREAVVASGGACLSCIRHKRKCSGARPCVPCQSVSRNHEIDCISGNFEEFSMWATDKRKLEDLLGSRTGLRSTGSARSSVLVCFGDIFTVSQDHVLRARTVSLRDLAVTTGPDFHVLRSLQYNSDDAFSTFLTCQNLLLQQGYLTVFATSDIEFVQACREYAASCLVRLAKQALRTNPVVYGARLSDIVAQILWLLCIVCERSYERGASQQSGETASMTKKFLEYLQNMFPPPELASVNIWEVSRSCLRSFGSAYVNPSWKELSSFDIKDAQHIASTYPAETESVPGIRSSYSDDTHPAHGDIKKLCVLAGKTLTHLISMLEPSAGHVEARDTGTNVVTNPDVRSETWNTKGSLLQYLESSYEIPNCEETARLWTEKYLSDMGFSKLQQDCLWLWHFLIPTTWWTLYETNDAPSYTFAHATASITAITEVLGDRSDVLLEALQDFKIQYTGAGISRCRLVSYMAGSLVEAIAGLNDEKLRSIQDNCIQTYWLLLRSSLEEGQKATESSPQNYVHNQHQTPKNTSTKLGTWRASMLKSGFLCLPIVALNLNKNILEDDMFKILIKLARMDKAFGRGMAFFLSVPGLSLVRMWSGIVKGQTQDGAAGFESGEGPSSTSH